MPKVSFRMASAYCQWVFGVQTNTARKIHRSDHTEGRLTTAPSGCCVRKGTVTGTRRASSTAAEPALDVDQSEQTCVYWTICDNHIDKYGCASSVAKYRARPRRGCRQDVEGIGAGIALAKHAQGGPCGVRGSQGEGSVDSSGISEGADTSGTVSFPRTRRRAPQPHMAAS